MSERNVICPTCSVPHGESHCDVCGVRVDGSPFVVIPVCFRETMPMLLGVEVRVILCLNDAKELLPPLERLAAGVFERQAKERVRF